ncbi:MAG: glucose 1-dehydrogenase [Candidatus Binataceae bacterium]|nr:glucose 1-dehydrogenase [Candidatus Binataceae bacterium]
MSNSEFKGKVAIVTGGGSGIGRAAAIKLGAAGAKVVVADLNAANSEQTCSMMAKAGAEAVPYRLEVSRAAEVEAMVAFAVKTFGGLDCAVNNAGIQGEIVPTVECSEENWDRIIAVNLKGVFLCLQYELREMLRHGKGAIVNTGSNFALVGSQHMPAYSASKHGVAGLTKTAAIEVAPRGIRVNAVCPGPTLTALSEAAIKDDPSIPEAILGRLPIARWGSAEEIAEAIVWLCSDAARFVIGAILPVDGGYVAQ